MIENNSGWRPVGHAVLLRAFELMDKQSLIHVPDEVKLASATCDSQGVVVAIGADCWNGEREHRRAEIGDKVLITKFSGGVLPMGEDGYVYRMVPDHAIYAVKEKRDG